MQLIRLGAATRKALLGFFFLFLCAAPALAQKLTVSGSQTISGGTYNDLTINAGATLTVNGSLDIINSLTVNGTLIINGNLSLGNNNASLTTGTGSYIIIFGNATLNNKVDISLNSYFIVTGDFTKLGSDNQGKATITNGKVYVFGSVSGYNNVSKCDGTYNGTTSTAGDACDAGGFTDLINNVNPGDLPSGVFDALTNPNTQSATGFTASSAVICNGAAVTLTLTGQSNPDNLTWYRDNTAFLKKTSSTTQSVTTGGTYYVIFRVGLIWYKSNSVTLTAVTAPSKPSTITGNANPCSASSGTYSVTQVSGLTYIWTVPAGWSITSGQGSHSITVTTGSVGTGTVSVSAVATGYSCESTAQTLSVTVKTSVSITTQPSASSQTACAGGTFTALSVTATSATGYQWYSNPSASNTGGTAISGATSASYTPAATTAGTTYYYCVVTGTCGNVTSTVSGAFVVNPLLQTDEINIP